MLLSYTWLRRMSASCDGVVLGARVLRLEAHTDEEAEVAAKASGVFPPR